jgi:hypothetical protein
MSDARVTHVQDNGRTMEEPNARVVCSQAQGDGRAGRDLDCVASDRVCLTLIGDRVELRIVRKVVR